MSQEKSMTEKLNELSIQDSEAKLENKNNFKIICISPNDISSHDFNNPTYLLDIFNEEYYKDISINPEKFSEEIGKHLEVKKLEDLDVKLQFLSEDTEHIYEMLYVDVTDKNKKKELENQLATLINTNGDTIYGNAIIFKTHVPLNSENMLFQDITVDNIQKILFYRANNIVCTYDDNWKEIMVSGDIQLFSDNFFGEDKFKVKKKEFAFLMHNINIWYTTFEYAEEKVCGKLINERIEKCFIFSKLNENYRVNLKLDEVNKIIKLSEVLEEYEPDKEMIKEETDSIGRKIIKNKYRILNKVYQKYF